MNYSHNTLLFLSVADDNNHESLVEAVDGSLIDLVAENRADEGKSSAIDFDYDWGKRRRRAKMMAYVRGVMRGGVL